MPNLTKRQGTGRPLPISEPADDNEFSTRNALAGLVGWAQMILSADDMPAAVRQRFANNHRLTTALIVLSSPRSQE